MRKIQKIPMFYHEYRGRPIPAVDREACRLVVDGAIAHRLDLSLRELEAHFPVVESRRRFYCVNGWSLEALWRGIDLGTLLASARPDRDARFLRSVSMGGYEDTSVIRELVEGRAMLATHMDGEPLSAERGAPLRLLVFDRYQFRGVKAVSRLEVVREYSPGNWVQYGYSDASIQPFPHLAIDTGEEMMPDADVLDASIDQP